MKTKKRILILEDDRNILNANRMALELSGYEVAGAGTIAEARQLIRENPPDLLLLDILLPDGNGLEFCRELKKESPVRILFLSALGEKKSVIEGLRAGGDDYLAKPYLTEELLLRVQALLRRGIANEKQERYFTGPLEWNPLSLQVFIDGKDLLLQPREYAILRLLCENEGKYVSGEDLYSKVWNSPVIGGLSPVHNHIYSLRTKLDPYGIRIDSARGEGYRIVF
jgi:DNA-binding response OmpR family regulator